ncbi:response regulator [Nibricoccus aquaticus]|uniref:Response regulator n=1 Tax=Nibricoccus aquaticus TaxID=2576891 RepID=A0A290Q5F6_9BACT|nr:response regulator [Nibricoccus aquaticus]ATC63507.1 response regulator [Nibricoccus aquaticus]
MSEQPPVSLDEWMDDAAVDADHQVPRILLVDDDEVLRMVQAHFLRRFGYHVDAASDGMGAIKHLNAQPADLVITDMVMPGTDGVQLIQHLRKHHPAVKIVAISGGGPMAPDLMTDIARALGADATLMKPFTLIALLKAVRALMAPPRGG